MVPSIFNSNMSKLTGKDVGEGVIRTRGCRRCANLRDLETLPTAHPSQLVTLTSDPSSHRH